MRVELDVYSGRVNPGWVIDPGQAADLERRLAALTGPAQPARVRDALGYRGVRIAPDPRSGETQGGEVFVSAGVVRLTDRDGRQTFRRDPGRELERWLVATGENVLQPDLLAFVRLDLAGGAGPDG